MAVENLNGLPAVRFSHWNFYLKLTFILTRFQAEVKKYNQLAFFLPLADAVAPVAISLKVRQLISSLQNRAVCE